jgi:N-acetylmuramoyl-L-alanine amidase
MAIKHGQSVVDTIFVHCSATRAEWMAGHSLASKVAEIRRWHVRDRGWKDIGYHWIIDRDGQIAPGRPETRPGAHASGHNTGSIGVCLLGGHGSNADDDFSKNFTPAQERALRHLLADIKSRTPIKAIRGHNEVAAKACPGFTVKAWLEQPRKASQPAPKPAPAPASGLAAFIARLVSAIFGRGAK